MKKIIMILPALFLSACTTIYSREDIYDHVKENYDISNFTVDEEYEEIIGEDGYTDKLWTVHVKDGITFHVLDDFAYVGESVKNSLCDDYNDELFKEAYQTIEHSPYLTAPQGEPVGVLNDKAISVRRTPRGLWPEAFR